MRRRAAPRLARGDETAPYRRRAAKPALAHFVIPGCARGAGLIN
jgi:hypothetical protein